MSRGGLLLSGRIGALEFFLFFFWLSHQREKEKEKEAKNSRGLRAVVQHCVRRRGSCFGLQVQELLPLQKHLVSSPRCDPSVNACWHCSGFATLHFHQHSTCSTISSRSISGATRNQIMTTTLLYPKADDGQHPPW